MSSPRLATSWSKLHTLLPADVDRFRRALQSDVRSLLAADVQRFRQTLQSSPAVMRLRPLATSCSKLGRLLLADVRRVRRVRPRLPKLLQADVRRFRVSVGFPAALNLELEQMRLYASLPKGVTTTEPWSTTRFLQEDICYVMCAVHVRNMQRRRNRQYAVAFRYYKADGSFLGEVRREWIIKAESQRAWMSRGWGWPDPGRWTPGEYHVRLLINGVEIARRWFTIDPPPPPMPPAANLHQLS
jgi:hypothetical protein